MQHATTSVMKMLENCEEGDLGWDEDFTEEEQDSGDGHGCCCGLCDGYSDHSDDDDDLCYPWIL